MKRILTILLATSVLTSCYETTLYNTSHPTVGAVDIEVIEPDELDDQAPESYTVTINGVEATITDNGIEFPEYLDEGEYMVYIYNEPDYMSIANNTAPDQDETITATLLNDESGYGAAIPGALYFGKQMVSITNDSVLFSEIEVAQITRNLYFDLSIIEGDTDGIATIETSLSGIAPAWECIANTSVGEAVTIVPTLTPVIASDKSESLEGHVRCLGMVGSSQVFTIVITFENGNMQTIVSDLSTQLEGFNTAKSTPLTLSADISIDTSSNATGTITDWTNSGNDVNLDAEQQE